MAEMEQVSIINKIVKAASIPDGIDNTSIISYMYPNFVQRSEIFYDKDNDVLYQGKGYPGLKQELQNGTRSFIAVVTSGLYDIDFTNREVIIKVLYTKWSKEPNEDTLKLLNDMTEHDFWNFFKRFWILGSSKLEKSDVYMTELFKHFGKQRHDIMRTYFKLRETYDDSVIFSAVLGFLEKAMTPSKYEHLKGSYQRLLQEFNKAYGDKIRSIVQQVYLISVSTPSDREYRTIWMLSNLGTGFIM